MTALNQISRKLQKYGVGTVTTAVNLRSTLNLDKRTVRLAVRELVKKKVLKPVGHLKGVRGKPAVAYAVTSQLTRRRRHLETRLANARRKVQRLENTVL